MLKGDRREIYRYLGYRGTIPEEGIRLLVEECLSGLLPALTPRQYHQTFPLSWDAEGWPVLEGMALKSRALKRNLAGCEAVCLLAVTLGPAPDRQAGRAKALGRASTLLALQACGAALIEEWADEVQEEIREEAVKQGYYLRPRFSPGYGDLPLSFQRDFFQILKAGKHTGITLTESLLMIPTKSVTALIGLTREKGACPPSGCEVCEKRESCPYRRA